MYLSDFCNFLTVAAFADGHVIDTDLPEYMSEENAASINKRSVYAEITPRDRANCKTGVVSTLGGDVRYFYK